MDLSPLSVVPLTHWPSLSTEFPTLGWIYYLHKYSMKCNSSVMFTSHNQNMIASHPIVGSSIYIQRKWHTNQSIECHLIIFHLIFYWFHLWSTWYTFWMMLLKHHPCMNSMHTCIHFGCVCVSVCVSNTLYLYRLNSKFRFTWNMFRANDWWNAWIWLDVERGWCDWNCKYSSFRDRLEDERMFSFGFGITDWLKPKSSLINSIKFNDFNGWCIRANRCKIRCMNTPIGVSCWMFIVWILVKSTMRITKLHVCVWVENYPNLFAWPYSWVKIPSKLINLEPYRPPSLERRGDKIASVSLVLSLCTISYPFHLTSSLNWQ